MLTGVRKEDREWRQELEAMQERYYDAQQDARAEIAHLREREGKSYAEIQPALAESLARFAEVLGEHPEGGNTVWAYTMAACDELEHRRAEILRLEDLYETARDLLEYRTGQYAAMSKAASEAEADDAEAWALVDWAANLLENLLEEARTERANARRWEAEWKAGFVQVLEDYGESRRWARAWKRKAKQHRAVYKYYVSLYLAECERRDKLEAPQPCGHPGACIVVGESWGDGNVHSCAWCADVALGQEALRNIRRVIASRGRTNKDVYVSIPGEYVLLIDSMAKTAIGKATE